MCSVPMRLSWFIQPGVFVRVLLLSRGEEEVGLSAKLIYFPSVWIRLNQWLCMNCRCCERPTCPHQLQLVTMPFGKGRMVNFWQRKTIPLAPLAVCTSSMFIPMPFVCLMVLSTKVFWFPVCLGWQLIIAQGSCWVSQGEVVSLPMTQAGPLLPWLTGSTLWVDSVHLQDVEEEG